MLPHVAEAVHLWESRGFTAPFFWNDLDCHLTIAISPDRKRILIAELNISTIEHRFPVFVFEGHEAIAGTAVGMRGLKAIPASGRPTSPSRRTKTSGRNGRAR